MFEKDGHFVKGLGASVALKVSDTFVDTLDVVEKGALGCKRLRAKGAGKPRTVCTPHVVLQFLLDEKCCVGAPINRAFERTDFRVQPPHMNSQHCHLVVEEADKKKGLDVGGECGKSQQQKIIKQNQK